MADYSLTPRQTTEKLLRTVKAGLVANIKGSPAIGKSAVVAKVAKKLNLKMIDHRLSTSAPEDLTGLPYFENGRAKFFPFSELFPLEGDTVPEGYSGWLLFLDELPSASKSVQAAAYKLILDRMVGQHKLHPDVHIVAAGNLDTDRAITNSIGTAMQSRLVHLQMVPNFTEWYEDVALKQDYDERIIGFLHYSQKSFYDFEPSHSNNTFCAPRTWQFMNQLVKGQSVDSDDLSLFAGTISPSAAAEFIAYCKVSSELIRWEDVVKDPMNIPLPSNPQIRFATITHLMGSITEDRLDKMVDFIGRLDLSSQVMFFRGLILRHPELRTHAAYKKGGIIIARSLNGKD